MIYAATLARDAFESLSDAGEEELDALAGELLGGEMSDLIVTPRDIDRNVRDIAKLIGYSLNLALHDGLTIGDIDLFLS